MHAPMAQSLAEILVVLSNPAGVAGSRMPARPRVGIQQEASEIIGRRPEFALQGIIEHHRRRAQVVEEIAHAGAHGPGKTRT